LGLLTSAGDPAMSFFGKGDAACSSQICITMASKLAAANAMPLEISTRPGGYHNAANQSFASRSIRHQRFGWM